MALTVKIVTPAALAFEGTLVQVQIPGWNGEYGVLPGHAKMLTLTRPGVVKLHSPEGKAHQVLIGQGFAEISAQEIVLLVDLCEELADIDKGEAQKAYDAARVKLETIATTDPSYSIVRKQMELERARLHA
jgi:F-type H+-transporting ATPase subunit epsilon